MAITDDIFQAEDKTFRITNKDDAGAVIDLDTATEIIVRVLDGDGNTIDKYNKAGGGGFRALDIATPSSGIMDVHLNEAESLLANVGSILEMEIRMTFANTDFDGNTQESPSSVKNLGIVRESRTKND